MSPTAPVESRSAADWSAPDVGLGIHCASSDAKLTHRGQDAPNQEADSAAGFAVGFRVTDLAQAIGEMSPESWIPHVSAPALGVGSG